MKQGWAASDFRWMQAASLVLGTDWESLGVLAAGVSEGTWKRFLAGKVAINAEAFKAYCEVLRLDWQTVAEVEPKTGVAENGATALATEEPAPEASTLLVDWSSAPDDAIFYGRQSELDTLRHWVIEDRCRLITLLGMGGIGKTALSVR
ncbi:ATP-binding protein, partial [Nodosilinea sp. LEGE 07298]|nr:ATP-binding protein [Nodosilinea sp. LEGE 07298]